MKKVAIVHAEQTELSSEIFFLKKEIEFLLKILSNCYSSSMNGENINLLDGYWNRFETNKILLDLLLIKVEKNEGTVSDQENLISGDKTLFNEEGIIIEFYEINKLVKGLKESFYEYMAGCCACSFKKYNYENSYL